MLHTRTRLCELLGIELPIISAPMGPDLSGPDLVAAVSGAGGLGILQAQLHPPQLLREALQRIRSQTDKPFGVGFVIPFPHDEGVAICLEERVAVLWTFWGDPTRFVAPAHAVGVRVFAQVGSVADARAAAASGVDVVVAQGAEAGGHVAGEVSTLVLVPRVVDTIAPVPVVASGGIADGRGLVAALALGADAAAFGTRFLATNEANAHPLYKDRLLLANETDTVRTILFGHGWPHAPHRALRTKFVEEWLGREERAQEQRPDEPVIGHTRIAGQEMPVHQFLSIPPNRDSTGDIASMELLAGQGVGLVHEIRPAAEIVRRIADEARAVVERRLSRP
jgi:NAD(P)H-dependent flavin oxidoreductase YrpB (nitropropane dioxygenase family)